MTKKYELSICIPAYNRADFLKKNLEKLAWLIGNKSVEIVVCDDSTNNKVKRVVRVFKKNYPRVNLVYRKNNKRLYLDPMILKIISMASGKFCWLMGDDDSLLEGSLEKVLEVIKKYPDLTLIHTNYSRFDNLLQKTTAKKMVSGIKKDIYFRNAAEFFFKQTNDSYFEFLGTNVITMSTNIVNRSKWNKASKKVMEYLHHNFIHCFVIGKMIIDEPKIYFISKPQIEYLANNQRVWPNDIWKDYNNVLLNYFIEIGYPAREAKKMQRLQKKYEQREKMMKGKISSYIYKFLRPGYSWLIYLKQTFRKN